MFEVIMMPENLAIVGILVSLLIFAPQIVNIIDAMCGDQQ